MAGAEDLIQDGVQQIFDIDPGNTEGVLTGVDYEEAIADPSSTDTEPAMNQSRWRGLPAIIACSALSLALVTATIGDDIALNVTETYADIRSSHDPAYRERHHRDNALEANRVAPIGEVVTDSGIKLVLYLANADASAKKFIFDPDEVRQTVNFVIDNFGYEKQDLFTQAQIDDFKTKAANHEYGNVVFNVIINTNVGDCVDTSGSVSSRDSFSACKIFVGNKVVLGTTSPDSIDPADFDQVNKTILAGPDYKARTREIDPDNVPDILTGPNGVLRPLTFENLSQPLSITEDSEQSLAKGFAHELAHAIGDLISGGKMGDDPHLDREHTQIVVPIEQYATALYNGYATMDYPTGLPKPFRLVEKV